MSRLGRFLVGGCAYRLLTAEEAGELFEVASRFELALEQIARDADNTDLGEQLLARVALDALRSAT